MGGRDILKQKLKNFLQSAKDDSHQPKKMGKKTSFLIIFGLIGLLLLIIGNAFSSSDDNSSSSDTEIVPKESTETPVNQSSSLTADVEELESSYETDLESMLNKIQGVSDAEVLVNLDSTTVKVYEKDLITNQQTTEEEDTNGGTREVDDSTQESTVVLVRQADKEVPLLVQTKKPDVRGVFVIAKGADHPSVEEWIVESISRVLDVPVHRVSVKPKK